MQKNQIRYAVKSADKKDIVSHLTSCNNNFLPPLDQKVNINDYSKKIAELAVTFEAWHQDQLVGLVAAYFNDEKKKSGYITNVSVDPGCTGYGIATELMKNCIEYAKRNNFTEITLEVSDSNQTARNIYKKLNFTTLSSDKGNIKMRCSVPPEINQ